MKVIESNNKGTPIFLIFVCWLVLTELFPSGLQYTHLGHIWISPTSASNKIFWYFRCNEDQVSEGKSFPSGNTDDKFLGFLPTSVKGNELLTQMNYLLCSLFFLNPTSKNLYTKGCVFSALS